MDRNVPLGSGCGELFCAAMQEAERYKYFQSQQAKKDLGNAAIHEDRKSVV